MKLFFQSQLAELHNTSLRSMTALMHGHHLYEEKPNLLIALYTVLSTIERNKHSAPPFSIRHAPINKILQLNLIGAATIVAVTQVLSVIVTRPLRFALGSGYARPLALAGLAWPCISP